MADWVNVLADSNFSSTIKFLDTAITAATTNNFDHATLAQLYFNRGICNQKLQLNRKALKDFESALTSAPNNVAYLFRHGQVLHALKKTQEATTSWQKAMGHVCITTDLQLVMDIASALKSAGAPLSAAPQPAGIKEEPQIAPRTATTTATTSATAAPEGNAAARGGEVSTSKRAEVPSPAKSTPTAANGSASSASAANKKSAENFDLVIDNTAPKKSTNASTNGKAAKPNPETKSTKPSNGPNSDMSANATIAVQVAVTQINNGQCAEALTLLDRVLTQSPRELGALVARGTARALVRDLKGAIADFSVAIEVEPRYADSFKRRGQARSALGELDGALADLEKAEELSKLWGQDTSASRSELLLERGMIHQKRRDYRRAVTELRIATKLDSSNPIAWNSLGLVATSTGDIREGVKAYETAVKLQPKMKEAWMNMAQALKEEGQLVDAEKAFQKVFELDEPGAPTLAAMRVMAQMRQQCGEHQKAVEILDKALQSAKDMHMIELLFLRAICHHALGSVRDAVKDYEAALAWSKGASEEARGMQILSFYQKEMALYWAANIDRPVISFCIDAEIPALFKELWCKKGPPTNEFVNTYRAQPPLSHTPPTPPPRTPAEKLQPLTIVADKIGGLLQNNHQGFMPNIRQQRAAGYAAVELAQSVLALLDARRQGKDMWVQSAGSSSQAGTAGRHQFGWRDAMDIVVKWRQLAEPNDQVVWVDLLTKREFEQGFGSHTPMFTGQTKCVRYYMNFKRALDLAKQVLLREGHAMDAANRPIPLGSESTRDAIRSADTAENMFKAIGTDSWVVVPIESSARPNVKLEGTRLTLVKLPDQPDAYEFSIRTPVTPPRWRDFDAELEWTWDQLVMSLAKRDPAAVIIPRILTYVYYWYNFMPLARGTAACGYTTLLALFWVAGCPVTANIPRNYQVDWEAILAQSPAQFIAAVSTWLVPAAAKGESEGDAAPSSLPPVSELLPLAEVLSSFRNRIEALNGENGKRVQL